MTSTCRKVSSMAKIYIQNSPCPWGYDGTVTSATCVTSGSFSLRGYARLTGMVWCASAIDQTSGVAFQQSLDGTNWDYSYKSTVGANSGSAYSLECVGEYGRVLIWAASDVDAASVRTEWRLRPV